MEMNVELLKKVATKLRRMRHKQHFTMPVFARKTECGTAFCIGGLGLILKGYKPVFDDPLFTQAVTFISTTGRRCKAWPSARRLFGLTSKQAARLFEKENWPDRFGPWNYDDDPKLAAARIDHFIATNGKE